MYTMRAKFNLDKIEKTTYAEILTFSVVCPPKFDENGLVCLNLAKNTM